MASALFIYCPICATPLHPQPVYGRVLQTCPRCDFVHFPDPKVAVIGLVLHQGRVLLARRAIEPAKGKWALPGGFMDAGEMPATALQRELREEVGLTVTVESLLEIYPMAGPGSSSRGIVLAYRVRPSSPNVPPLQPRDDVSAADWYGPGEIPAQLAFSSTHHLLARWRAGAEVGPAQNGRDPVRFE